MVCDSILSWVILMAVTFVGFGFLFFAATRREGFRQVESDKITSVYRGF